MNPQQDHIAEQQVYFAVFFKNDIFTYRDIYIIIFLYSYPRLVIYNLSLSLLHCPVSDVTLRYIVITSSFVNPPLTEGGWQWQVACIFSMPLFFLQICF